MSSFSKLFEDKKFYNSVMEKIAKASYKDLRSDKVKYDENTSKSYFEAAEKSSEYREG